MYRYTCVYEAVHQGQAIDPSLLHHGPPYTSQSPSLTPPPHRIVDNLPVATRVKSELRPDDVYYVRGFPVGTTGTSW